MDEITKPITVPVEADISAFSNVMGDLQSQSRQFASIFSSSIKTAIQGGKSFEDTLKSIALKLSSLALSAALKPLEQATAGLFQNLFSGGGSATIGSSATGSGILPFAKGGVIATPTYFNAGRQLGVMGEAGAEAVMPLARDGGGRLGVRMQGAAQSVNVVFNVTKPDVQGFRKSEGQVSAMLARTIARSRRTN